MEVLRPLRSSVVRYLTSKGATAFIPHVVSGIKARYEFWQVPQTPAEFNLETGASFNVGKFRATEVSTLQVFNNGIMAQGDAHTEELDAFLADIVEYVSTEFGLSYSETQPVSKLFTSALEIRCDPELLERGQALREFANTLTAFSSGYGLSVSGYQLAGMIFNSDPTHSKPVQAGRFLIERRTGHAYEEGVYYSEAPVSSEQHVGLLKLLEKAL